jgi:hypothetical protein
MIALSFGLAWVGYAYGLYGYCLIKGYDVKFTALVNPVHVYQWPDGGPPQIPNTKIFPSSAGQSGTTPVSL